MRSRRRKSTGLYRSLSGNQALGGRSVCHRGEKAGLTLFRAAIPLLPRSYILHELCNTRTWGHDVQSRRRNRGDYSVYWRGRTRRACDYHELQAPGMALKTEAMASQWRRDPMVIAISSAVDRHRLPHDRASRPAEGFIGGTRGTHSRTGGATSGRLFWVAIEASRIASSTIVTVIILSDGYPATVGAVEDSELRRFRFPVKFASDTKGFFP